MLGSSHTIGCLAEPSAGGLADTQVRQAHASEANAAGIGVAYGALAGSAVRSIDGTYGGSCLGPGKAGSNWSVSLGGTPAYGALAVVKNDGNCRLSLTRFQTAAATYTASAPIVLGTAAGAPLTLFTSTAGNVYATAVVDTLTYTGSAFAVTLYLGDAGFGLSNNTVARYTYDAQVVRDAPLSYWRLNERPIQDALDDTNALDLRNHTSGGLTWTPHVSTVAAGATAVFDANYVRAGSAGMLAAYTASLSLPAGGDYEVAATIRVASLLSGSTMSTLDQAGVIGRMSSSELTGYFAGLVTRVTCGNVACLTREWVLRKYVNGVPAAFEFTKNAATSLVAAENVVAGRSYALALRMKGNMFELGVDGVTVLTGADVNPILTPGTAGILVGGGTAATSPSEGTLIEDFDMKSSNLANDLRPAANHGVHSSYVPVPVSGALTGPVTSTNAALRLSGSNHVAINNPNIGVGDFSVEFWFKYAGGVASSATSWISGMGLVDANSSGLLGPVGFGVSMRSDGKVMAGAAVCLIVALICSGANTTLISGAGYGDNLWHHVVFTRKNADGVLTLYVDNVSATGVGPINQTLSPAASIQVGRTVLPLGTSYFTGAIDEVAIYDKVLTPAQVSAHYAARGY